MTTPPWCMEKVMVYYYYSITTFTTTWAPCNHSMDYRRSEFANIDNRRWRCAAAMMDLLVTPLSSDFKKNGAGFSEREVLSLPPPHSFFTPPPICHQTHANHVHLKVQIISMGLWGGGGVEPSPNPVPFFLKWLLASNNCIRGAIVYTFTWRTAVNGVVEVGWKKDIVKAITWKLLKLLKNPAPFWFFES